MQAGNNNAAREPNSPEWAAVRLFLLWSRTQLLRLKDWLRQYGEVLFGRSTSRGRRYKYAAGGFAACVAVILLWIYVYTILLIPFTPGIGTLKKSRIEQPSVVLSADGEVLTRYSRVNREWVPLEEISESVTQALIATEDHRFYEHPGVDPVRIVGAALRTLTGDPQGGSTITQQLARNMFPDRIGRSQTFTRKLKEMITAFKIEYAFEKDEILEAYLNTVPFYFGAYGIEMAARTYFSKSASELDILESATLVGMLKGTYYYNPVRNPDRAQRRRNVALHQMAKRGFLEEERYEAMADEPIRLNFERQSEPRSKAPHFTEHIRLWLVDWADRHDYNIYRDSLVIHTTLDLNLQRMAEEAVERQVSALQVVADVEWSRDAPRLLSRNASAYHGFRRADFSHLWSGRPALARSFVRSTYEFRRAVESGLEAEVVLDSLMADPAFMDSIKHEKTRLQVGFTAIDPKTGWIRAWVGSRDFEDDQYDHVARARRQPGSTFKPFVYARALEEGYRPDDKLEDVEVEIPLENGYVWKPQNAGETVSGAELTLTEGLVYSKNTITAQLVDDVGASDVARLARRMGVNRSTLRAVPSLALGTSEVSLLEMVSAYGTFADDGVYHEPIFVTRIEDRNGRVLDEFQPSSRRVLPDRTARAVVDMLRGVVDRGTGSRIRATFGIRQDVAGKTGTTQDGADGWFIMMHPNLVAGAWIGFNDPRVTFRTDYWGQGGNNALLVVGDFFRQAIRGGGIETGIEFPPPPDYDEKPPLLTRIARWIGNAVASAWRALFGDDGDGDEPRQSDTYISDRERGTLQIDFGDEESDAIADSLTRLERQRNRLDTLAQSSPPANADTSGAAAPPTEAPSQPEDAAQENEENAEEEGAPEEDAEGEGEAGEAGDPIQDGDPPQQDRNDDDSAQENGNAQDNDAAQGNEAPSQGDDAAQDEGPTQGDDATQARSGSSESAQKNRG